MFLIYMWVDRYKGLENFEITFDNNYEIKYNREEDTLSINKKCESENQNIKNFYSIDKTKGNVDSVNLLIGKNGSGKTSVLEVLNMLNLGSSNDNDEIQEINMIILYKSNFNNEDFILEKYPLSMSIEIKESQKKIKVKEVLFKVELEDEKNYKEDYLKNLGIIKISFKEGNLSGSQRELLSEFGKERTVFKLNIGLENESKKYIYDYLIKIRQEKNNDNFENAYLTLSIPDLYAILINLHKDIILNNLHSEIDDKLFRLYDINSDNLNLKDIILNNCFNYIYLYMILATLDSNDKKIISKENLRKRKDKFLELLNNKSANEKFEILLKEFEILLKTLGKSIEFNIENYKTVEDIVDIINDIKEDDETCIKSKKFIVNFKNNEKIKKLLEEYDNFYIPQEGTDVDLLFQNMKYIQIKEEGLSDGERIKLQYFSTLHGFLNGELKDKKYVTFLFDEVETYLHPEWSRKFLYELIEELEKYEDKKFKLIFATHSPFLIADVLAKDCIYLSKNKKGKIKAEIKEDVKTFGANIVDLFKDTMFLESTFGKFATEKIKWAVDEISDSKKNYSQIKNNPEIKFLIDEIGEKLISNKLKSMIESKFERTKEEYYYKKIRQYKMKLKKLKNKKDKK